jgi:hypothetical protein
MSTPSMQLDLITTKLYFDAFRSPGGVGGVFVAEFTCENLEDKKLFPNPATICFSTKETRQPVKFIINQFNDYSVVTSAVVLDAFQREMNVNASISSLPEVIQEFGQQLKIQEQLLSNLKVLQFPVNLDFRIKDYKLRSHVINLIIYRNLENNIEIVFVDSTLNPLGLKDLCFGMLESVQVEMGRLLYNHDFRAALRTIFGLESTAEVTLQPYFSSGIQSSLPWPFVTPDKRCALYAMNLEAKIINTVLSSKIVSDSSRIYNHHLSREKLIELAALAHQEVYLLPEIKVSDLGIDLPLVFIGQTANNNIYRKQRLSMPYDAGYGYIEPVATNADVIKQEVTSKKITLEVLLKQQNSIIDNESELFDFEDVATCEGVVGEAGPTNVNLTALHKLTLSLYSHHLLDKKQLKETGSDAPLISLLRSSIRCKG